MLDSPLNREYNREYKIYKVGLKMKIDKKITTVILTGALITCIGFGATGCAGDAEIKDLQNKVNEYGQTLEEIKNSLKNDGEPSLVAPVEYSDECYEKIKYIDSVLSDRDCVAGESFKLTQRWISWNLMQAGYDEEDIIYQPASFTRYYKKDTDLKSTLTAVDGYETDGKFYTRSGRNYVEAEDGDYVKVSLSTPNIAVTKKGKSEKQIIVGAHYDGDGTGDNGSGIALALATAEKIAHAELEYTVTFVFFTAEEYGLYGSTAYAEAMTDKEVENTLYMINLDSLVCGDYAYIYGGVQDDEKQTVTQTEALDNAMEVASSLGLSIKNNPWTWDKPAPGYDKPDYASPSTGDWSDHVGFKERGIPYVYFEATNWEIPGPYEEYDGYGETYLIGMLMNTQNDYLEYIEKYFPGRIREHLKTFSTLLYALVTQTEVGF